ncbi:TPA: DUF655 domain-containing protein [Candidatus Woesearchaeota archaeon]|nr:DUF655 domain-containing protein [Candidatus Woesearchaeota archaeon]
MEHPKRSREEYALVLDFLQNGYAFDKRPSHVKTAIVQALGKSRFTLLELVPKKEVHVQPHEIVYIGDGKRDKIHHIIGRLPAERLTNTAQKELEYAIDDIIKEREQEFVGFYNKAQPLSTRMHQLELLPGVGKKHMGEILEAKRDGDFQSFEDIRKRVKLVPDPRKLIIRRIINEVMGKEKHRLFADA